MAYKLKLFKKIQFISYFNTDLSFSSHWHLDFSNDNIDLSFKI